MKKLGLIAILLLLNVAQANTETTYTKEVQVSIEQEEGVALYHHQNSIKFKGDQVEISATNYSGSSCLFMGTLEYGNTYIDNGSFAQEPESKKSPCKVTFEYLSADRQKVSFYSEGRCLNSCGAGAELVGEEYIK